MNELVGLGVVLAGSVFAIAGLGWLVLLGFRSRWWIGLLLMFTIPLGTPLIYGLVRFRQAKRPLALFLGGVLLGAIPVAYGRGYEYLFGLGERERMIDGERHLILTGWDRTDYDILAKKSDVVVLEIGNADVTDETLEKLPVTLPDGTPLGALAYLTTVYVGE